MKLARPQLTLLFNALYEAGITQIEVTHPADEIGTLVAIRLEDPTASPVRIHTSQEDYAAARGEIDRQYGQPAITDLPDANAYTRAVVASGTVGLANREEIDDFLDQHGSPDLNAGHRPVFAGFDTNLLPWRIPDVLGLRESGYWSRNPVVNGFALATGVRNELDWDHKHSGADARQLGEAFGPAFEELFNQPVGSNREGRLGEIHYRQLRDHQYADEIQTDRGDEAIVDGYDTYQAKRRKDLLLFSNDRNFIERARGQRILSQHVAFPRDLPRKTTGSWSACRDLLYLLTVIFGVIEIPKMTLHGVWAGKQGRDWTDERIRVDCRSPVVAETLKRQTRIVEAWHD